MLIKYYHYYRLLLLRSTVTITIDHRRTAPSDLGGGDPIARKKLHNARKHVLYKRTQTAVKTKTFKILTSNERIITPELQLDPDFSNLQEKRNLFRKIGYFEKSGVTKITMFDWGEGNHFWIELLGGSKNLRFERSGFNCSYFETSHTLWLPSIA